MLSDYVGEELFLKGVSIYLKKHLYANSVTTDLWEGISEATGKGLLAAVGDPCSYCFRHRYRQNHE